MANPSIWAPEGTIEHITQLMNFLRGTSTSTVTIADTGTRTFQTQAGLYFRAGDWLITTKQTDPDVWMAGSVVSYDIATGILVFAPEVASGSGSHSLWNISLSGVWVPIEWSGGTVTDPAIFSNNVTFNEATLFNALVQITGKLEVAKTLSSNVGNTNLAQRLDLDDANVNLTPADIFNKILLADNTANRIYTLPSAADIIAALPGYEVGNNFDFTIINLSGFLVTLGTATGIIQVGKTDLREGSGEFRVIIESPTIVSVSNKGSPVEKVGAGDISTGAVTVSAVDIVLDLASPRLQSITMTAEGNSVTLPAASGLVIASPVFVFTNDGFYPFGVKDSTGTLLTVIPGGANATISLVDNTTLAGKWPIGGSKLDSGLITFNNQMSTAYAPDNIFSHALQLDTNLSVHFCAIVSNGLATFVVDRAGKAIIGPVTITTTALMRPCGVFKIDATSYVVFYSATNATTSISAVVVTLASGSLTLGTPATYTLANSTAGVEDGISAPKLVQLDTNLFLLAYGMTSATQTNRVVAMQISSGVTCTWGSEAVLPGGNTAANNTSQIAYKLGVLTALVLYKTATASPFQGRAMAVSVTNANPPVCSMNTGITTLLSKNLGAASAVMINPTVAGLVDDNDVASQAALLAVEASGVILTASSPLQLDTGVSGGVLFSDSLGTRHVPKLARLTDTSIGWIGYTNSNVSRLVTATVVFPALTLGTKLVESFSQTAGSGGGAGKVLAWGSDCLLTVARIGGSNSYDYALIPHKIAANTITVGKPLRLEVTTTFLDELSELSAVRLPSGLFVVNGVVTLANMLGGTLGFQAVRTDGINIIDMGIVYQYASSYRGDTTNSFMSYFYTPLDFNRLVMLSGTQEFSPTLRNLRVSNIDFV